MGYKTLLIRDSDKLRLYLDNIVVENENGETRFLISNLKYLIIDNHKTVISAQLINKLVDNNVSLVICDLSHHPNAQLIPLNGHFLSSGILNKQLLWSNDLKREIHSLIVKHKINSQIVVLRRNNLSANVINKLSMFMSEVEDDDKSNREGLSAKMYFKELFGDNFIRFEDDIINAGLNYGYAIFRSLIEAIIVSKGLNPNIGIFHRGETNHFNLADDIIEVYRPIVDNYVYNNLSKNKLLTKEHRDNLIKLLDIRILFDGQIHSINNTIEMYIESIMKCFDNNDSKYVIFPSIEEMYE